MSIKIKYGNDNIKIENIKFIYIYVLDRRIIMKLYHGTSVINGILILKNGFDINKSGSNWGVTYGKGIYFTPNYETARFYAGNDGMVISLNININPFYLTKDVKPNSKKKPKIPEGYDSLINPNGDEVIILNMDVFNVIQ